LATPGSRVVNISSQAHRFGKIDFDDLHSEKRYSAWGAYGQSKLANLLFTFELQRRLADAGSDTIATAAHPGASNTNLGHEPAGVLGKVMELGRPVMDRFLTQTAAMGALPTLRAATDPSARGGDYFGPSGIGEQKGHPVKVDSNARSKDLSVSSRLWDVSVDLTGVDYAALDT
jgi:NAD(P)-dependent dehydrogenase (short-subunit alcohol dehydrogenase family)